MNENQSSGGGTPSIKLFVFVFFIGVIVGAFFWNVIHPPKICPEYSVGHGTIDTVKKITATTTKDSFKVSVPVLHIKPRPVPATIDSSSHKKDSIIRDYFALHFYNNDFVGENYHVWWTDTLSRNRLYNNSPFHIDIFKKDTTITYTIHDTLKQRPLSINIRNKWFIGLSPAVGLQHQDLFVNLAILTRGDHLFTFGITPVPLIADRTKTVVQAGLYWKIHL